MEHGDIIQITKTSHYLCPGLLIVDRVTATHLIAYIFDPDDECPIEVRKINKKHCRVVGKAVVTQEKIGKPDTKQQADHILKT